MHMGNNSNRRRERLESPQANVRDGEEVVIADVGATWLAGVAIKVSLVINPDTLCSHHKDQHPKDKDHRQPDATKGSGVLVDSTEKTLEKLPIHEFSFESACSSLATVFKCGGRESNLQP
uniref:Uncharacterized protein n=1 Tax=Echeneis naucrates TaxID=173247 RepID=A0A665USY7_ECHNA